jgi:hypothetical protein
MRSCASEFHRRLEAHHANGSETGASESVRQVRLKFSKGMDARIGSREKSPDSLSKGQLFEKRRHDERRSESFKCTPFTGFAGGDSGRAGSDEKGTSRGVSFSSYRSREKRNGGACRRQRTSEDGTSSVKAPPGARQRAHTATGQHADDRKVVAAPRRVEGPRRSQDQRRVERRE